jgi:hypothetical protein
MATPDFIVRQSINTTDSIVINDIVQLNDEAVTNWKAMDYEKAECLLFHALTMLHSLCKIRAHSQPKESRNGKTNIGTTQARCYIQTYDTKVNVRSPSPLPGSSRIYQKAFSLFPMIQHFDQESLHLIAVVVFYNAGLFYQLAGSRLVEPRFRCQLIQRYYHRADTLLGHFMDTTRQSLWTLQAAIWHNLAISAVETFQSYNSETVWVNMSQLDSIVGWVEDAGDRRFFHQSIQLAHQKQNAPQGAAWT